MRRLLAITTVVIIASVLVPLPAFADGFIVPRPPHPLPAPVELSVKYHRVNVTITGQVALTEIDQVFVNESLYELEGTYIFPLPAEAAISDFAMYVDGKRLEGQILDRDKARQMYEEIVRGRRDPALLEYVGRNAFRATIFPIPARGEKRVQLSYRQVLTKEQGLVKYVYPLSTEQFSAKPIPQVSITIDLTTDAPLKSVYSPSHPVAVERVGTRKARVSYEESAVRPDTDFSLYYSTSGGDVGVSLLSYKEQGADGFFLLLVAPDAEVEGTAAIAKDVTLILDTSGSMRGSKMSQTQEAALYILDHLRADDRFNIVAFSSSTWSYARGLQPAAMATDARRFVRDLQASGSTDINRALLEGLEEGDGDRPHIIIFLTDGLPTVGEVDSHKIIANVDRAAQGNVRLFTFGVGDDVNTTLLDTISQEHRGASAYVRPSQQISDEVASFYAKVSTPVLTDLALDFGAIQVEDVYPYPLPDLFVGSQLVVVGRYRQGGDATLMLKGEVNGEKRSFRYEEMGFTSRGGESFIPYLWATRKVGHLLDQIRLHGENRELVDEIVELSVRYGILTPYTSFLVNEREDVLTLGGRQEASKGLNSTLAAPAPTSGAAAVDRSVGAQQLRSAETVASGGSQVKQVGGKAFILRQGVWTDTTYNPDRMRVIKVGFASDGYFALLARLPEAGIYLSLGERVIVVLGGQAYETVAEDQGPLPDTPQAPTPTPAPALRNLWERLWALIFGPWFN